MSIFNIFDDNMFGNCDCCLKPTNNMTYYPIFGVAELEETNIWCTHARPIKLTKSAIEHYKIKTKEAKKTNSIQLENTNEVLNKTIGVVRRIKKHGKKTTLYHCPKYKLLQIKQPDYWNMCTATIECLITGKIEDKINISRLVIPKLLNY